MAYVVMQEGLKVPPSGTSATVGATITDAQGDALLTRDALLGAGQLVYVPDAEVTQFNTDRTNRVLDHTRTLPGPSLARYRTQRAEDYTAKRRATP